MGDIRFGFTQMDPTTDANTYAYAYTPTGPDSNGYSSVAGDIWINKTPPAPSGANFSVGANGFETLIHEIGHTLGLDHSFEDTDTPGDIYFPADKEFMQYSVMSYSDTQYTYDNGASGYYPTTPMLYDIQAIQYLYGANMHYHAGNDVYTFNGTSKYYQTIWDAGGTDTIKYVSNIGGLINLNAGEFSSLGTAFLVDTSHVHYVNPEFQYENVAIAFNVTIENAIGSNGDDTVLGNSANNQLTGGAGGDTISGSSGNDTLDGGAGIDSIDGGADNDTIYADIVLVNEVGGLGKLASVQDAIDGGTGNDTLTLRGVLATTIYSTVDLSTGPILGIEHVNASATGLTKLNLTGNAQDNLLIGNAAANSVVGGLGNDTLDGGLGNDTLNGGDGDDTYVINVMTDVIRETIGNDTVKAAFAVNLNNVNFNGIIENISLIGAAVINATGNAEANIINGNDGANVIDGGAGVDAMNGGKGNDIYIVSDVGDTVAELSTAAQGGGIDLVKSNVSFVLDTNVDNLILTDGSINGGTSPISGTGNMLNNVITGNAGNNLLMGNAGNDTLTANDGNDTLDGGAGNDNMNGGKGDDAYVVDSITDALTEALTIAQGGGIDTVQSNVTRTLGANFDNLILTGGNAISGIGNTLNNSITGNDGNNRLIAGAGNDVLSGGLGNDTLDGGTGIDVLTGGLGDDTYWLDLQVTGTAAAANVNTFADSFIEQLNEGSDTLILRGVATLASFTTFELAASLAHFENINISATGNTKIHLIGNEQNNSLIGNAAANSITGAAGNDTLDGGAGADTLNGGAGNDIYIVDVVGNASTGLGGDVIIDGDGIDTAITKFSANLASMQFAGIENLTLFGAAVLNATGDELDNTITGNSAANILNGALGDDLLNGMGGNDSLLGGDGNDTLVGGAGIDTLDGGAGNDVYSVDSTVEITRETLATGGIDRVESTATYTLGNNLENLTLLGISNINATGNALDNALVGNLGNNYLTGNAGNDSLVGMDGNDTLNGGFGADTMAGGAGSDIYYVDNLSDVITEDFGAGIETVYVNITGYTLADNAENLTLNTINGTATGNALNNVIIGSIFSDTFYGLAGDDTLNGTYGDDILYGGAGNDTYYLGIASQGTQIIENANEGVDTIIAVDTGSLTLAANVENLRISNYSNAHAIGNALNNTITATGGLVAYTIDGLDGDDTLIGNAKNDTLHGGQGNDSLQGADGNDFLFGDDGSDTLTGGGNHDTFYFNSPLSASNVDQITDFVSYLTSTATYDELHLDDSIFTSLATGFQHYLNADEFLQGTSALDSNDFIIYNKVTGNLYYDADGSGATDKVLFATLSNHENLAAIDIWIA